MVSQFESGKLTQFTARGLVFKTTGWQTGYTGQPLDTQNLTVAGAVLLKHREIELAAITRGPFNATPYPDYVVFALNRGAGASLGPVFPDARG